VAATAPLGTYGNGVGTVTPLAMKMAQLGPIVKTTTVNVIRAGLFYNGSSTIVTGKANMSYDVAAFTAVCSRGASAGATYMANDGTYNVATTAAPGSNSRYDVVYVWPREYSLDGTDSNPVIGVVQGTAAASPTVPSLAAYPGAIELARILVPAGVTATNSGTTITQTAPFTSVDGGKVPFRTTTEMNVWTTALTNQRAVDLATGINYRWNGSAWKAWESDWITYTCTPGNFTIGTGGSVNAAKYRYVNGRVEVDIKLVLGSSGASVTGVPVTLTLPVNSTAWSTAFMPVPGGGGASDTSASTFFPAAIITNNGSVSTVRVYVNNPLVNISSTVPFTWAATDVLAATFSYDPA